MITLKVWQLMLGGLVLLLAIGFLMLRPGSSTVTPATPGSSLGPDQQTQLATLRAALPAVTAWGAKHKGYAGLKLPAGVTVVQASKPTFCIESVGAEPHVFKNGPTAPTLVGTCSQPSLGQPTG